MNWFELLNNDFTTLLVASDSECCSRMIQTARWNDPLHDPFQNFVEIHRKYHISFYPVYLFLVSEIFSSDATERILSDFLELAFSS